MKKNKFQLISAFFFSLLFLCLAHKKSRTFHQQHLQKRIPLTQHRNLDYLRLIFQNSLLSKENKEQQT